ncbi:MAG: O-antigen ligase family protein [Burkholderiales bacterium]
MLDSGVSHLAKLSRMHDRRRGAAAPGKTMDYATKLDRIVTAPPALLLFLLPFAHTTALRSIALALTVAAAIYAWRKDPGPSIPLKVPLGLWLGMALATLAWARDPGYSFGEIRAVMVYDIVYFFAFFALARQSWQWNLFRAALLAGLVAIAGIAAWVHARTGTLNTDSYLGGVLSISTHLVAVFPLLLVAAFEFRRDGRALAVAIVSAAAALFVGYFTFNRMFILAIAACSIVVAAATIWRHYPGLRRLRVLALAAAVLVGASGAFFVSVAQHHAETHYVGKTVQMTLEIDPRRDIWKFSLDLIREHPFSGVGFGLFAAEDLYREKFPEAKDSLNTHAHNPFLNSAVQMGLGGVAALLFLLFCLFREFWALWRSDRMQVSLIGAAGLAMLIGVLVKAQPDDLWGRHNGYLFWAITGMMLGHAHRLLRGPGRELAASSEGA